MPSDTVAVGVDAAPNGWIAVRYEGPRYVDVSRYRDDEAAADSAFERLWAANDDADVILVDIPIGLAESNAARRPEDEARERLGPRSGSVFNVPIRSVLEEKSYDAANAAQKDAIDTGLMQQTYNITDRIREVDDFLQDRPPGERQRVVRESHPELCFWALNEERPMAYSKTGQPAAAHWERVGVLATVHDDPDDFHDALADAGGTLIDWHDPTLTNDDLLDAFALAVTGSDRTGPLRTLPEDPDTDETGLRMEMVYAEPA